jgi:transcriptional regulator with XRE-family HTH domain
MTFDEWVRVNRLYERDVAKRLGVNPSHISRLRRGERNPTVETQRRIFEITDGQVTGNDWLGAGPRTSLVEPPSFRRHRRSRSTPLCGNMPLAAAEGD